jgi:pectinesterase inhibitor-like protein
MAFQDFDLLSERRQAERKRKMRKRVAIAVVSSLAIAGVVAGVIIAVVQRSGGSSSATNATQAEPTGQISHSQKMIKMICSSTDYRDTCKSTFDKAVKSEKNLTQPKDLLKVAIGATFDEVKEAFDKTKKFKFNSPQEKAAFEDCKQLLEDAVEELHSSVSNLGDSIGKFSSKTPDLNNWLSAAISYQHSCVDGFPDGKLKTEMQKTLKIAKELTSNSLAIISEVSSFLTTFQIPGATRHLLEKEASGLPAVGEDGLPSWMNQEERRILKGKRGVKLTPNVVVAKDGSGKFKTISEALAAMPEKYTGRYVIYIKAGIYDEYITVTKKMVNVTMYGDGSQKTIVTGNKNFVDGVRTFQTASFAALGDGFMAQAMGFRNTAGPEKHQAVAIRVQSDRAIFLNCRFEGYQDTLYVQTHRQFYRSCVIAGTVDFIFGDATAILQNCLIVVRKPLDNQQNIVTAQGRVDRHETTGIVLQNCRITADKKLIPVKSKIQTYLGRPWKEFSRTIIMESSIEDFIDPAGFMPWEGDFALKTLYYAEFNNKGPGAKINARVKWPGYKKINKQEAAKFTVGTFLDGDWIKGAGVPVHFGLYN